MEALTTDRLSAKVLSSPADGKAHPETSDSWLLTASTAGLWMPDAMMAAVFSMPLLLCASFAMLETVSRESENW